MKIDFNVLHAEVKNWISTNKGGADIITVNSGHGRTNDTKLLKQRLYPRNFGSCGCYGIILCFSWWSGNGFLFRRTPWNSFWSQKYYISTRRSSIINVTCPIGIREGMQRQRWIMSEEKTMINISTDVWPPTNVQWLVDAWIETVSWQLRRH